MPSELALLSNFDQAKALIRAADLTEAMEWMNRAEALRIYAVKAKKGQEIQNQCAEIKIRAERRAGEILAVMGKDKGGKPTANQFHDGTSFPPKLSDLGIDKHDSHRWQLEASLPEEKFIQFTEQIKTKGEELTSAGLRRFAIKEKYGDIETLPLPEGVFDVIYADPPWKYDNTGVHGAAEHHYATMDIDQIAEMEIPAADNAALFLWVTSPFAIDALYVVYSWGFDYKTNMVWVKTNLKKPGTGFYVRVRHELLYICTKGSFVPDQTGKEPIGSVVEAPVGEHSEKPEVFYDIIEKIYPGRKYLELFARKERDGWTSWGKDG